MTGPDPLDNAVWSSLSSYHEGLGEAHGRARRYRPEVSVFTAVDEVDDDSLADLATLVGPSRQFALFRGEIPLLPPPWRDVVRGVGHQLVLEPGALAEVDPVPLRRLTDDDVPAMLELVAVTAPGPFVERTIEMGRYVGHVDGDGRLLAMAGERLHIEGHTEISAVCTHPDARGRGLAAALTHHVAAGILERGERAFLHVADGNDGARRVYERLGFAFRRSVAFALIESPPA